MSQSMKIKSKQQQSSGKLRLGQLMIYLVIFLTGCLFSTSILLFSYPSLYNNSINSSNYGNGAGKKSHHYSSQHLPPSFAQNEHINTSINNDNHPNNNPIQSSPSTTSSSMSILQGKRILIALTSFDFSQFPLLEEVLDSYQDLCFAGASKVHIYIYTTVPYTVALIDLLNTRLNCDSLQIYIVVKTPALRLNLVDCHRTLFYDKIEDYDVFIYSEVCIICILICFDVIYAYEYLSFIHSLNHPIHLFINIHYTNSKRTIYSSNQPQSQPTSLKPTKSKTSHLKNLHKITTLVSYGMNTITHPMSSSMIKQDMQLNMSHVCIGNIYGNQSYLNPSIHLI